jgi:sec-independent protein translocase protein TatA
MHIGWPFLLAWLFVRTSAGLIVHWRSVMFGGQLGLPEMLVIMVIALLIFGPKKLPSLGKSLGEGITSFKKAITHGEHEAEKEDEKQHEEDSKP